MPQRPERADIEIGAGLTAKRLRLDQAPEKDAGYLGDWSSVTEREKLPPKLEEGTTYRDVEVRWNVDARIAVEIHDEIEAKMRER
jgi:hypothetical protein